MTSDCPNPGAAAQVVLQLIDPTQGAALKTWRFEGKDSISIGRSPERDVEVLDPYVSRHHADLACLDGEWRLHSRGRNGVLVRNQPVDDFRVRGEVTFRLGSAGPVLKFSSNTQADENLATLSFDAETVPLFLLDEPKVQEEVGAIVGRDDFLRLQQQIKQLRQKRIASA